MGEYITDTGGGTLLVNIRNTAKRFALVGGAVVVAGTLVAVPMASASAKSCTSANGYKITGASAKLTCAGIAYYKGKTITFVSPDSPGGGFNSNAGAYQPYLAAYLGATVNVINIPAGNTVAGMNDVAGTNTSANVGLTVGWMNLGPAIEDKVLNIPGVQFNPTGEDMLGGTTPSLSVMVALKSPACAAWDNGFAGLLASNSATNPVSEPIQTTGSTTLDLMLINGVFGIHYKAIPGYSSSANLISGWFRGDGCVIDDPTSSLTSYIQGGQAVPLLLNEPYPSNEVGASLYAGVPTYASAVKTYKKYIATKLSKLAVPALTYINASDRVFFAPPKTPHDEVAALTAAFKWASKNPNLIARQNLLGNLPGYTSPQQNKVAYIKRVTYAEKTKQFLTAIG
jgi:tripartite-type tricarboxylate transporter receptor subunit TctC